MHLKIDKLKPKNLSLSNLNQWYLAKGANSMKGKEPLRGAAKRSGLVHMSPGANTKVTKILFC